MPVDTTETELALAALDDEILELTKKRKKLERTLRFQQREVVSITVSGCGPNVDGEYFRPKRPYDEAILFSRRAGVGTENTHIFKELLCGFYIGMEEEDGSVTVLFRSIGNYHNMLIDDQDFDWVSSQSDDREPKFAFTYEEVEEVEEESESEEQESCSKKRRRRRTVSL